MGNITGRMAPAAAGDADSQQATWSFQGVYEGLKGRVAFLPNSAAHVAIVVALVCAFFISAINGNFVFLLFVTGGCVGEGYIIYQLYHKHLRTNIDQIEGST